MVNRGSLQAKFKNWLPWAKANAPSQIAPPMGSGPMLALHGVTKAFPGVVANDCIDLEIYGGQVHAILGENGAGKSTLTKIIYGFYRPDSGTILVNGLEAGIRSPNDSRRLGIGMVFQDFSLIPAMSVAENVALFLPEQGMFLSRPETRRRIEEVSARYGLQVDPDLRVDELSLGERQKVELIKLLLADARLLIFDEPTSVLAPHEVDSLFHVFSELKDDGYAVIFITHKMREALAAADVVTVIRNGAVSGTIPGGDVDEETLVSMMVGEGLLEPVRAAAQAVRGPGPVSKPALEFRDVWTAGDEGIRGLRGASFRVDLGEILGVAGVAGNGQQEFGDVLLGLLQPRNGTVHLFGEDLKGRSTVDVLADGVGYVPEDAMGMALVPQMRVDENLMLGEMSRPGAEFWLDWNKTGDRLSGILAGFPLPLASQQARVSQLSGGNVQRVLLARELTRRPKLLLACYPTRGLDVLTAESARSLLVDCRDEGRAVVLISEDLDELFALCDRIVVMFQGRIVGEFQPDNAASDEATIEEIGLLMTGR